MTDIVRIDVTGCARSGKTTIAAAITQALRAAGLHVDMFDQDGNSSFQKVDKNLRVSGENLDRMASRTIITVDTHQAGRAALDEYTCDEAPVVTPTDHLAASGGGTGRGCRGSTYCVTCGRRAGP